MTKVSKDLRNIFCPKIPPILKLEVGFFSDRKCFSQIFENWICLFHLKFISIKNKKKSENLFGSSFIIHHSDLCSLFYFIFSFLNKLQVKKIRQFSKICEKRFLSEKNPTSSFKIRGFDGQKRFFKLAEISLIIGLK